jgi:hypothetical protein
VIYSIIDSCGNNFILTNGMALPSAVSYFVTPDKSPAFRFEIHKPVPDKAQNYIHLVF